MINCGVKFDKLTFKNYEKETFEKFIKIKGAYLHKQIYDVLLSYNAEEVTYYELSNIIRYDKNLRDTLYKYLATFEEKLRSELFAKYDVDTTDCIYKRTKGLEKLKKDIHIKTNFENSNLYFCYRLDLGATIDLLENLNFYSKVIISDLRQIKELRNRVMHHNILVVGNATDRIQAEINLQNLKHQIAILCKHLPCDYQKGYQTEISNLNVNKKTGQHYLDKLCLENIAWNI